MMMRRKKEANGFNNGGEGTGMGWEGKRKLVNDVKKYNIMS